MTRIEKLYAQILANRTSVPFREFQKLLEAFGLVLDRTNGSHHIYKHPTVSARLSIQPRNGKAKPYQIEQFLDMIEAFGLEMKK